MGSISSQLRLPVPVVDTPDHVVEQLAEAARNSRLPSARRGRFVVPVATVAGVVLLSVGGAWATGAVNLPGLPEINVRTPQEPVPPMPDIARLYPTPAVISPPAPPVDQGPSSSPGVGPRVNGEHGPRRNNGEATDKRDKPAHQSTPGQKSPGQGTDNPGQQKDPGRSQSPDRSEQAPQGPEKRKTDPSQAAAGPDTVPGTSRSKHLGSSDRESSGRG